ncbi:valine--tRNA ligase [Candidatus Woesearchaeota archaeon]|nr:valine--tRNA ligase [Candidatus Woesearchaeota archaeon]
MANEEIPKKYDWKESENKWKEYWEKEGVYKFDPKANGDMYAIDTPPPTVSGKMHIGHAFSYSQQDFMVRFNRMKGKNIFYPFGTDDNGLATERLIEKMKKVKSTRMERKDFVKLCLETLDEIRPQYIADWKHLGISCDFSIFYTTINEHCQRISQKSFIELYKMGREYQKEAPTMWCPECRTAIAQVELQDQETPSTFNHIIFKLDDGKELIIATTRPELLPACVSIFAHPDDKRYKKLFGKNARVPIFGHEVPIMASQKADPEKGTGILMCCTFGDQDDIEHYKEFNLPLKIAITKDGRMSEIAGKYKDMPIKDARKAIIEDLKNEGLLLKQEQIKHTVNVHERCGTEIEILETKQWFIKYLDLKDEFKRIGREMNWHPPHMRHRYDNWIDGLRWDWCISRQRHFGVPFPVWYCKKCGEVAVADESQLPVDPLADKPKKACAKCKSNDFEPEKDVLDTWATSSLTPQLATELFKNNPVYKKIYPMSLRPQAHDIITFWLFNTVVKNYLHYKSRPWNDIAISGWALDPHGKKMSKSKGNVVEPQAVWQKYPVDALRFWAGGSKLGDDMPYQEKDLVTGVKTITKLWNAARFAFMHLGDYDPVKHADIDLEAYDKALISKLNRMVKSCTESFENYEYSKTKMETEKFFWQDLCDYYLEVSKDRLYNPDKRGENARRSAQHALYRAILTTVKLLAPIMPYITEEIYHTFFKKHEKKKSIHLSGWPSYDENLADENAEILGKIADFTVEHVRRAKSEQNISLKEPVKRVVVEAKISEEDFEKIKEDIKGVTHAEEIVFEAIKPESKKDMECTIDI